MAKEETKFEIVRNTSLKDGIVTEDAFRIQSKLGYSSLYIDVKDLPILIKTLIEKVTEINK